MKIVMVGPFGLHPLGTMRVRALPLARALVARGHSVTMLLPPWQNPEDAGLVVEDNGVRVENMRLPQRVPGWFQVRLTAQLCRRARQLEPDVVHAFKPKAYAGLAHLLLRRRFPVVVDTDDWEGPGGWNDLQPYSAFLKRFFTWQERFGLRHAKAVTTASRALQTLAWATGGAAARVFYLPNGVDPLPGSTRDPVFPARPTILLYTRFYEADLDRVWRILSAVRAQRPEVSVLVVGKGFFGEENELLARARAAGWHAVESADPAADADLIYTGYGTADRLPLYFARADVGLYLFDDTLVNRTKCPVKLLDILAAGVPVVGEAVGEISAMVQHGTTGLLAAPADETATIEAVLTLLGDPERRAVMSRACRHDVSERFAWATLAETAEAAYTYALRRPKIP